MLEKGDIQKDPRGADDQRTDEAGGAIEQNARTPSPWRAGAWLTYAGAAITCGIALFVLCTWWWWRDWRPAAASQTIPMAPGTALILMLVGVASMLRQRWGGMAAVRVIAFVAAGIAAAPAIIAGIQFATGVKLAWEGLLSPDADVFRGIPLGHMSPLSAGALLLSAISQAALLPPLAERRLFQRAGLAAASLGLAVGVVVALAYAAGTPLFYSGSMIPMASLTAIALVAFNLALLSAAIPKICRPAARGSARIFPTWSSLRRNQRNLLFVMMAVAAGILLTSFLYLRAQQAEMRGRIADNLEAIADLKARQIVNWLDERKGDARLLDTPLLARSAARFLANPDSAARGEILAFIDSIQPSYHYEAVVLFDDRMNPRLAVPPAAETSSPRLRALLEEVFGAGDVVSSDLYRGVNGNIYLDLLAPIRDSVAMPSGVNPAAAHATGALRGAFLLQIDARDFLYPLIRQWPVPSETAETLLVRREGDRVVYLNDLLHQPGAALTLSRSINDLKLPAAMAARGISGVSEGVDYRGSAVLATFKAVPETPWVLVAKEDLAEIYEPLRQQAFIVGMTLAVLLFGAVFTVLHWLRQMNREFLYSKLAAETQRKSLADRLTLITQHANDIILLMDENKLIVEANDRALTAYGYTLDEFRRLPVGGLRTDDAKANLPEQLDLVEALDGTVFETVHQRRDGTSFPVEFSARSVEIEGRHFSLGIYRDLTQRKAHEREIERLNRLYSALSQINQAIVRARTREELFGKVCQMLVEFGGFEPVWIGWVRSTTLPIAIVARAGKTNFLKEISVFADERPEGRGPTGRCIQEGRTYVCNDFAADPNTKPWQEAALRAGIAASIALPIREGGVVHGALVAYAGEKNAFGKKEIGLLEEAAADVDFALGHLETERQRSEAESMIFASEARYRRLFESSRDGILILDAETGMVVDVNPFLVETLCISRRQFLTMKVWEPGFFKDIIANQDSFAELQRNEYIRYEDKPLRTADGRQLDVEFVSNIYLVDQKKVIQCNIRDITERKHAEKELRESEERFRTTFERVTVGMTHVSLDGHWLRANQRFCDIVGYSQEELRGLTIFKLTHPDDLAPDLVSMPLMLAGKIQTVKEEKRYIRKDGSFVPIALTASLMRDESGKPKHFISVVEDITERRRTEQKLLESHRTLQRVIDNIPQHVFWKDLNLNYLGANTAFARSGGLSGPADIIGKSDFELAWRESAEAYRADDRAVIKSEVPKLNYEEEQKRSDGSFSWLRTSKLPLVDDAGKIMGMLGIFEDITERRHAEEMEVELAKEHEISEMKTRFISMISHEFRTPLTAVMASAELLHHHLDRLAPAKREELFSRINSSVLRLTDMLDGILTLNRVDTEHARVQLDSIDLRFLLHDAMEEIRLGDRDAHRFELYSKGDLAAFVTDTNLLRHIVSNLLSNATRYSPAGTLVAMRAEADPQCVRISVEDQGIGIPEADGERIFESFERGSNVGATKGTGLGLNIVKRMTELLGGAIAFVNVEGGGSRFTVVLPRLTAPATPQEIP